MVTLPEVVTPKQVRETARSRVGELAQRRRMPHPAFVHEVSALKLEENDEENVVVQYD
jgi:hypothetical protein